MKRRKDVFLGFVLIALVILTVALVLRPRTSAGATVFSSPINGGCYIAAPNQCKIHVDPFRINYEAGQTLEEFQLMANGKTIYHFMTDVSNPPLGPNYSPSLVFQDFAAQCGQTYTINIQGRDSNNANLLNMGQIENVTCPSVVP